MIFPFTDRELRILYINLIIVAITILIAYARYEVMYDKWQESELKLQSLTEQCADCLYYK